MKHQKKNTSNQLQRHLLFLTLGITLSVGILFSTIFTSLYSNYLETSLVKSTGTNLKFLTDSIDSNLNSIAKLVSWSQTNTIVGKYISTNTDEHYAQNAMKAHDRLSEEYLNSSVNPFIRRIVIGNYHERFIQVVPTVYSTNINMSNAVPTLDFYSQLIDYRGYDLSIGLMKDPFYSRDNTLILPIIRPIYAKFNASRTGWIFMEVSNSIFTDPLQYYSCAQDAGLFLILGNHTYAMTSEGLLPTNSIFSKEDINTINSSTEKTQTIKFFSSSDNKEYISVIRKLNPNRCFVVQTLSDSELQRQTQLLILFCSVIVFLMLIVGLLLNSLLRYSIALPVKKLRNQLSEISSGNFTPNPSIEWDNELGDIGHGINNLSSNLEILINKRIQDEKEKKDLEYKVLQNQVNPHFLYNTLNSIKWMATIQGAEGIADMTTSLSRLLRSISKGTRLIIPISEEIALIKDYFNIQKYRYGGTIQLEINCEADALLDYSIIKFTLQPIIENAIFHGLEPKGEAGKIEITIHNEPSSDGKNIEIIVSDNGVGIHPDKIDQLLHNNTSSSNDFFKEIGIANVHQRLQYEYGDSYGIHIKSVLSEYTEMHIVIPKQNV